MLATTIDPIFFAIYYVCVCITECMQRVLLPFMEKQNDDHVVPLLWNRVQLGWFYVHNISLTSRIVYSWCVVLRSAGLNHIQPTWAGGKDAHVEYSKYRQTQRGWASAISGKYMSEWQRNKGFGKGRLFVYYSTSSDCFYVHMYGVCVMYCVHSWVG